MPSAKLVISSVLGVCGGYVDVICMVRYGVFAATMTGNLVFIGHSLFSVLIICQFPDVSSSLCVDDAALVLLYRLVVIACHLGGVFAMASLQRQYPTCTASRAAPALALLTLTADVCPSILHAIWPDRAARETAEQWAVCLVAFSLGSTHYLGGPTSEGSRLRAPPFASTGHMHKAVKHLNRLCFDRSSVTDAERAGARQSLAVVLGMLGGALLGAVALCFNPLATHRDTRPVSHAPISRLNDDGDDDAWLLVPVAIAQACH